jgi:Pathogenicity locus
MMRKTSTPRNRTNREEFSRLEEVPNVGPAIAADLRRLGITLPSELPRRDPYEMYDDLCRITGKRHDPCLLDTFIAAVRFMEGAPKRPWHAYTAERKRELAARKKGTSRPKQKIAT